MLSKKPNSKLKSQIDEQNPRSETTNSHEFREKERERESWVFGHGFRERESWVFRQLREKGLGFRSKRVGFWLRFREREREKARFSAMNLERQSWDFGHGFRERERAHLQWKPPSP